MKKDVAPRLAALDWGTSSLRAYLLDGDGGILARAEEAQGILQVKDASFADVFQRIVGPWRHRHPGLPAIGSGMIGSRQGWREAPYAACPAGLDALATMLTPVETPSGAFNIVPGMNVVDADGVPDVMRGEETQILGQFAPGDSGVAVLPGTHSKWILVENGRIDRFATFMTGEAYAAMKSHTILGRLMSGEAPNADAFARGVDHGAKPAQGRGGLLHRLFSARTLGLFDQVKGEAIASYLSGLMIGSEIAEAIAWLGRAPARVTVIGGAALSDLYVAALARQAIASAPGTPDAAALGLLRVARAAKLV